MVEELERWLPVVGYEGVYSVSSLGRVRREAGSLRCRVGRVLRPGLTGGSGPVEHRYYFVSLSQGGKRKNSYVHDLVAAAFLGPKPDGFVVDHTRNKRDNRCDGLEYVTPAENNERAYARGEIPSGERHYAAKLSDADVVAIRASTDTVKMLAAAYGVSGRHVRRIRAGVKRTRQVTYDRSA